MQNQALLYRITDTTRPNAPYTVASTFLSSTPARWHETTEFTGHDWLVELEPAQNSSAQAATTLAARFYLLFEVIAALLMAGATLSAAARNLTISNTVKARTNELEQELAARARAEAGLNRNRQLLEYALNISNMGHWESNFDDNTYTFNDRFYALYGTTAEREGGYSISADHYLREFCHPENIDYINRAILRNKALTDTFRPITSLEHRIVRRDGAIRHMVVRSGFITNTEGHIESIHGANQDITELKHAEEALLRSQQELKSLNASLEQHVEQRPAAAGGLSSRGSWQVASFG